MVRFRLLHEIEGMICMTFVATIHNTLEIESAVVRGVLPMAVQVSILLLL